MEATVVTEPRVWGLPGVQALGVWESPDPVAAPEWEGRETQWDLAEQWDLMGQEMVETLETPVMQAESVISCSKRNLRKCRGNAQVDDPFIARP